LGPGQKPKRRAWGRQKDCRGRLQKAPISSKTPKVGPIGWDKNLQLKQDNQQTKFGDQKNSKKRQGFTDQEKKAGVTSNLKSITGSMPLLESRKKHEGRKIQGGLKKVMGRPQKLDGGGGIGGILNGAYPTWGGIVKKLVRKT